MKTFHISDVLSVTTGSLVSSRHIEGVYDILNFLTGDDLYTHQLGRAMNECGPWLRTQFPQLFPDNPLTEGLLSGLKEIVDSSPNDSREQRGKRIERWVETVRVAHKLPVQLPVYELGADMHTRIDPIEELEAMVGSKKVIVVDLSGDAE